MTFYSFMHKYRNSKHKTEHDENLPSQKDLEKYCNLQQVSEKKKATTLSVYMKNYLHFFIGTKIVSHTELHNCLLCTEQTQGQMTVHKGIAVRIRVQQICVFSLPTQTIFPKNRDKGHRQGSVCQCE